MIKSRTKKQALEHIRKQFFAGKLGAMVNGHCVYTDFKGRHCAVGCLFTPAQHAWLKGHNLVNDTAIRDLVDDFIGDNNINYMSGMNVNEIEKVQEMHDRWARATNAIAIIKAKRAAEFSKFLDEMIKGC